MRRTKKLLKTVLEDRNMWIFYAIGSSFFAGVTAVLAKCGIRKTDSDVATAIRTIKNLKKVDTSSFENFIKSCSE